MKESSVSKYKSNIHSQNGEDGILAFIFNSMDVANISYPKRCLEVGAYDGVWLSNTRNLILKGWDSIQIEGGEQFIELGFLYQDYPKSYVICENVMVKTRGSRSIDSILKRNGFLNGKKDDIKIGCISVDIDGFDYSVFKNLKTKSVVCLIENNSHIKRFSRQGITSLTNLGKLKGYKLVAYTGNVIFINENYFDALNLEEITPEMAWNDYWNDLSDKDKDYMRTIIDPKEFWKR